MNPPQVVCKALAGTGKTFTLVEGTKRRLGCGNDAIIPSPQQDAIWEIIDIGPKPSATGFAAFNTSIRDEMEKRMDGIPGCDVMTMHSLGFAAVKAEAKRRGGYSRLSKWKTSDILVEHFDVDYKLMMKNKGPVVQSVNRLTQLSKYAACVEPDDEFLDRTAGHYGVEINGAQDEIFDLTRHVLKESKDDFQSVNFDDMIWMPVVNSLETQHFDLLMVDEGQDLNHCQQQLAFQSGNRIVLVGDENQAIYGFAGADTSSMATMERCLGDRAGGVEVQPLTVTRRCSHAVVERAKKIVPQFEAHEDNLEGSTPTIADRELFDRVVPGNMILCRTNAPLIRNAFALIGQGVPAEIIGRDIKGNLLNLIKMLKAADADDLVFKLNNYKEREVKRIRKNPKHSEAAILAVEDKCECLSIFCRFADTVREVTDAIDKLFSEAKTNSVRLSSIHRAKGLEARNVFIIHPELLPHPMAKSTWEKDQERNLEYVAITRAIENLYFVEEDNGA
jgi:DNA helicase IV